MHIQDPTYKQWLIKLKSKIRSAQMKASVAVNTELILFYWDLGKMITEKQTSYGTAFLLQLSKDLQQEFTDIKGLSARNLALCRQFYQFDSVSILQQAVAKLKGVDSECFKGELQLSNKNRANIDDEIKLQNFTKIPWGHNILIFSKSKNLKEADFYIQKTLENNWSRDTLAIQIKSRLHLRAGLAITNFNKTLPEPLSDLAQQTLKDPYIFDFLQLSEGFKEKDIENQLVNHIKNFLLELGKGFAYVGQQYQLEIGEKDYYLDLLFYHIKLKCYVVLELKNTEFKPEYAGKLNFYLSAVDTLLKEEDDKPTIGILLCRDKNNIEAEFALRDINKPMDVSEFQITENLPDNLKSSLPTIEEIENELKEKLTR